MEDIANLPPAEFKRIVIVGGGFGGLKLIRDLQNTRYQIVLIDKNNYHQFQPLFYQVATSGLEPSAISFPIRKIFQGRKNVFFRLAEVTAIHSENNTLETSIGSIHYDYLVIASGCDTNYFKNESISNHALGMKSTSEALHIRNHILQNFENYTNASTNNEQYLNLVIAGGGATGVEIAGALAEMRNHILAKDYPEINFSKLRIILIDSGNRLLKSFTEKSSEKALDTLVKMGVEVKLNVFVKSKDENRILLSDDSSICSNTLIWAAGISGNMIPGITLQSIAPGNRYQVNSFNMVEGYNNIFAIGDIAFHIEKNFPDGFPQVAQVAIQQGSRLAINFKKMIKNQSLSPFVYIDHGSMATIGRNKAIVEIGNFKLYGISAWFIWMAIHLMALLGVKNKILIFINWLWKYFTYDQNLRLIIKQKSAKHL